MIAEAATAIDHSSLPLTIVSVVVGALVSAIGALSKFIVDKYKEIEKSHIEQKKEVDQKLADCHSQHAVAQQKYTELYGRMCSMEGRMQAIDSLTRRSLGEMQGGETGRAS